MVRMLRQRMAADSPIREIRLRDLRKLVGRVSRARYMAAVERMEELAWDLGVSMNIREWMSQSDSGVQLGTLFIFEYEKP